MLVEAQFAFYDFYAGKCHQIMAHVWLEAVKIMPQMEVVQVVAASVALQIRFSPKSSHRMHLSLWFGMCLGETIQNVGVNRAFTKVLRMGRWGISSSIAKMAQEIYSPCTTKKAVWVAADYFSAYLGFSILIVFQFCKDYILALTHSMNS